MCGLKIVGCPGQTVLVVESPESRTVELPSCYVDTAHIRRQPFTVHLLLGNLDLHGDVSPSLHVTLSPTFCRHLGEMLLAAAAAAADGEVPVAG